MQGNRIVRSSSHCPTGLGIPLRQSPSRPRKVVIPPKLPYQRLLHRTSLSCNAPPARYSSALPFDVAFSEREATDKEIADSEISDSNLNDRETTQQSKSCVITGWNTANEGSSRHISGLFFKKAQPLSHDTSQPVSSRSPETNSVSYENRFLPGNYATLLNDFELQDQDHDLHDLVRAVKAADLDAAWSAFRAVDPAAWVRPGYGPESWRVFDGLWWLLAGTPERSDATVPRVLRFQRVARLLMLKKVFQASDGSVFPASMPPPYRHRLLYLVVVELENLSKIAIERPWDRRKPNPKYNSEKRSKLLIWIWNAIGDPNSATASMDHTLLCRLVQQIAKHGHPRSALTLFKNEVDKHKSFAVSLGFKRAAPETSGQRSFDVIPEAFLDATCYACNRDREPISPEKAFYLGLEILDLAATYGASIRRECLEGWLSLVPTARLLQLLPKQLRRAAEINRSSLMLASPNVVRQDKMRAEDNVESDLDIKPQVRAALVSKVCRSLAFRGDCRPLSVWHRLVKVGPMTEERIELTQVLLGRIQSNIEEWALFVIKRGDAVAVAASIQADHLETGRQMLDLYFENPDASETTSRPFHFMVRGLFNLISLAETQKPEARKLEESTMAGFRHLVRRLTSHLLSRDPDCTSSLSTARTLIFLLRSHAKVEDFDFLKELWQKWQPRAYDDGALLNGEDTEAVDLASVFPLKNEEFYWFFSASLAQEEEGAVHFTTKLYLDWAGHPSRATISASPLPLELTGMFLRKLGMCDHIHTAKRVMLDLAQQECRFNSLLAKAMVECFRRPGPRMAEQSALLVFELEKLHDNWQSSDSTDIQRMLPLEIFSVPLTSMTSPEFLGWNSEVRSNIQTLFRHFLERLDQALRRPALRDPEKPLLKVSQENVRQCFNAAMKACLEWPHISLFNSDAWNLLDSLIGRGLDTSDLIPATTVNIPRERVEEEGEARRRAVFELVDSLETSLSVPGDHTTWSLKLLAWMLPGDAASVDYRKSEALKVWEQSLSAEYNYSRSATVPLSVQQVPEGLLHSDLSRLRVASVPSTKESPVVVTSAADEVSALPASSSYLPAAASPDSVSHDRRESKIPRPIHIRPRVAARFVLYLSAHGDFASARRVYETWLAKDEEILRLAASGVSGTLGHAESSSQTDLDEEEASSGRSSSALDSPLSSSLRQPEPLNTRHPVPLNTRWNLFTPSEPPSALSPTSSHTFRPHWKALLHQSYAISLLLSGKKAAARKLWKKHWRNHIANVEETLSRTRSRSGSNKFDRRELDKEKGTRRWTTYLCAPISRPNSTSSASSHTDETATGRDDVALAKANGTNGDHSSSHTGLTAREITSESASWEAMRDRVLHPTGFVRKTGHSSGSSGSSSSSSSSSRSSSN